MNAPSTPAIAISKGIPMPVRKVPANLSGRPSEYPWDKMEQGDSFPAKAGVSEKAFRTHASRMAGQMRDAAAKGVNPQFAKIAFVVGRVELTDEQKAAGETLGELRCWRAEDKEPRAKPVKSAAPAAAATTATAEAGAASADAGSADGTAAASTGESTDETAGELTGQTGDMFEAE